jgi:hypothetical protein
MIAIITFFKNLFTTTASNNSEALSQPQVEPQRANNEEALASVALRPTQHKSRPLSSFMPPAKSVATTTAAPAHASHKQQTAVVPTHHHFLRIAKPLITAMQQAPKQAIAASLMQKFTEHCQTLSDQRFRLQVQKLMQDHGYNVELCENNHTDLVLHKDHVKALVRTQNQPLSLANLMIRPVGTREFSALHADAQAQGFKVSMLFTSGRVNLCSREFSKTHSQFSVDGKALLKLAQSTAAVSQECVRYAS